MHRRGLHTVGRLRQRRPEVTSWAEDLYEGFWECDRNALSGALTMEGMCAVLDEYGVEGREERRQIRWLWRRMAGAQRDKDDELDPDKDKQDRG